MDPIKFLYKENIFSLKLKAGVVLVKYIDLLKGLEMFWQEIDQYVET